MTSDELFWRLVLVSRSLDEATLIWWLATFRADERPYREPERTLGRVFGLDRKDVFRVRKELETVGVVTTRVLQRSYTEFSLDSDQLSEMLTASGQFAIATTTKQLWQFDPFDAADVCLVPPATACSRICMLRRNREDAILLAWLSQAGAGSAPVRISSRDMEGCLGGLVDRRTAMRALARLAADGFVLVSPLGRAGTEYRLDGEALAALLSTCPINEDAAAMMPGWSNLTFPLLQRLDPLGAEAPAVVPSVALEV